jgi:lysophospholipase L1-like esterase
MPSVSSRRAPRAVLVAFCLAALTAAALASSAAAAARRLPAPVTAGSTYLALGDSIPFGYQEPETVPAPDYKNASSFRGYPEILGRELRLKVVNAACPGETTASLITLSALSYTCENLIDANGKPTAGGYRQLRPLHVRYSGSQLAYAIAFLRSHPNTRLVSLGIGGNDYFLCQKTTADACTSGPEISALVGEITRNVRRILSDIRNKAHYRGQIAVVNQFSLDYASAFQNAAVGLLNKTLATAGKPYGARTANGYGLFAAAVYQFGGDPCAAGLLNRLGSSGSCGAHPTFAGQTLLASALETAIRH